MTALSSEGHTTPTPIQEKAIPYLLEGGDLLGMAQTGTGKTAAFALPILHKLYQKPAEKPAGGKRGAHGPRALILAPTRELAAQVKERFDAYGARTSLKTGLVIGGAPIARQKAMLRRGVDILIATPGRLEDHLRQNSLTLDTIEMLVLDEVDQMLDLGFIHAIRAIAGKCPKDRQSLFFSATMPKEIARLANALLRDPLRIDIEPAERPKIEQSVMFMTKGEKLAALVKLTSDEAVKSALVFTRTKHGADKVVRVLNAAGVTAQAIHGNRSQGQRTRALDAFKNGKARLLVATDIAARGIDVSGVTHVVNYDVPNVPQTYVHRIGRTGRAGKTGIAISFCASDEKPFLRDIERLTGVKVSSTGAYRPEQADRDALVIPDTPPAERRRNSGPRTNRRRADGEGRPQRKKYRGNKPMRDESAPRNENAPRAEKSWADKPRSEKPRSERSRGEGSWAGKPRSDKPRRNAKPHNDNPWRDDSEPTVHARAMNKKRAQPKAERAKPQRERSDAEREADKLIAGLKVGTSGNKKSNKPHSQKRRKKPAGKPAGNPQERTQNKNKGTNDGQGRTARIRRHRGRSAA